MGQVHAAKGAESEARAAVGWALRIAQPPGYLGATIRARAVLGFLELGLGRTEEAVDELEEAARIASESGLEDPLRVRSRRTCGGIRAVERMDDARALATDSRRSAGEPSSPRERLAERCEGVVAARDFERRFECSLAHLRYSGSPFEVGRASLALGARLHRRRQRANARERLRAALDVFDRLGGGAVVRARCSGAAGRWRRRRAADPDDLTAQEVRVAVAVASGATSRQVASDGSRPPRGSKSPHRRFHRKLGIRSRAELATAVARGKLGRAAGRRAADGS